MSETNQKKTLVGTVVSNKMEKTVTVLVRRQVKHKQYQKYIQRRKKYSAHDEANECNIGDLVMIRECRPLSRNKRWMVAKTLRKAVLV